MRNWLPFLNKLSEGAAGGTHSAARRRSGRKPGAPDIPLLEWLCALLGFALVFGTAAFIVYKGVTRGTSAPDIAVSVESVAQVHEGYRVTLRAVNRGDITAADVKIEGTLKKGGRAIETSEMTFQYLPSGSERRGGLFFKNDPRTAELTVTAKGYEEP